MSRRSHPPDDGFISAPPERPRRRRGCWLALLASAVLALCAGGVVALLLMLAGEPNAIRVQIASSRVTAAPNEAFTVELTIENVDLDVVTIAGIGMEHALTEGARVEQMDPAFRSVTERDYPLLGAWSEYSLDRRLFGGEKLVVTLTLAATQPGVYRGDVLVWIEESLLGVPFERARRAPLELQVSETG